MPEGSNKEVEDKNVERLLQQEFSNLSAFSARSPDEAFAGQVMARIDGDQLIARDTRRPLIIGLAFLLGFVIALMSLTGVEWTFLDSINATSVEALDQWRGSPLWISLILLPLFWLSIVEA